MDEAVVSLKSIVGKEDSALLRMLGIRSEHRRIPDTIRTTRGDEIDFLAYVDEPGRRPLLKHVEIRTSKDPQMTNDMLARYAAIWRWSSGRPELENAYISPMVVYLGSARWKPKTVIDESQLYFKHDFVSVRDMDPGPFLESGNLGDVAFAVLCRGGLRPNVLKKAVERIASASAEERQAAVASLVALSDLRGIGDQARARMSA